ADSRMALTSDLVSIANLLDLPEKSIQDQNQTIAAVQHWMEKQTDWLLILDSCENLGMVGEFIPFTGKGHVLLTTRADDIGNEKQKVNVGRMNVDDGILFLLKRVGLIKYD